ncbi:hypothetical protein KIPB_005392 [Kipferlia bialata]|uniref:Uncharacterized protein n=1 Tax=Kipferlia bialata TaxID=797122 RepID=A0A9K3GIH8_9EUKA|nr:hypothetical protein KIPB_005392 [Kipferlia bialata]|eukprot:g5392.t1
MPSDTPGLYQWLLILNGQHWHKFVIFNNALFEFKTALFEFKGHGFGVFPPSGFQPPYADAGSDPRTQLQVRDPNPALFKRVTRQYADEIDPAGYEYEPEPPIRWHAYAPPPHGLDEQGVDDMLSYLSAQDDMMAEERALDLLNDGGEGERRGETPLSKREALAYTSLETLMGDRLRHMPQCATRPVLMDLADPAFKCLDASLESLDANPDVNVCFYHFIAHPHDTTCHTKRFFRRALRATPLTTAFQKGLVPLVPQGAQWCMEGGEGEREYAVKEEVPMCGVSVLSQSEGEREREEGWGTGCAPIQTEMGDVRGWRAMESLLFHNVRESHQFMEPRAHVVCPISVSLDGQDVVDTIPNSMSQGEGERERVETDMDRAIRRGQRAQERLKLTGDVLTPSVVSELETLFTQPAAGACIALSVAIYALYVCAHRCLAPYSHGHRVCWWWKRRGCGLVRSKTPHHHLPRRPSGHRGPTHFALTNPLPTQILADVARHELKVKQTEFDDVMVRYAGGASSKRTFYYKHHIEYGRGLIPHAPDTLDKGYSLNPETLDREGERESVVSLYDKPLRGAGRRGRWFKEDWPVEREQARERRRIKRYHAHTLRVLARIHPSAEGERGQDMPIKEDLLAAEPLISKGIRVERVCAPEGTKRGREREVQRAYLVARGGRETKYTTVGRGGKRPAAKTSSPITSVTVKAVVDHTDMSAKRLPPIKYTRLNKRCTSCEGNMPQCQVAVPCCECRAKFHCMCLLSASEIGSMPTPSHKDILSVCAVPAPPKKRRPGPDPFPPEDRYYTFSETDLDMAPSLSLSLSLSQEGGVPTLEEREREREAMVQRIEALCAMVTRDGFRCSECSLKALEAMELDGIDLSDPDLDISLSLDGLDVDGLGCDAPYEGIGETDDASPVIGEAERIVGEGDSPGVGVLSPTTSVSEGEGEREREGEGEREGDVVMATQDREGEASEETYVTLSLS